MAERAVRELLVVELLGGIGDLLIALPAVHALARAHPRATVRVLTFAPGDKLLARDPLVHEAVGVPRGADAAGAVTALLDRVRPDLAVTTTTHSGIPALLRARVPGVVADLWQHPPPDELVERRFLRLLAASGRIDPLDVDLALRVALDAAEVAAARPLLPERRPLVLVPASGMSVKRWPQSGWERLAVQARALGREPVAVGEVVPGARLLPGLPLRGLAAMLQVAAEQGGVAVGADTGPLRLASAVGLPAVALHGPSAAGRYGLSAARSRSLQGLPGCDVRIPADFTQQACWWSARCPLRPDGEPACLHDIGVQEVLAAVDALSVPL